jgi:rhodanese-related sulfurtransferase
LPGPQIDHSLGLKPLTAAELHIANENNSAILLDIRGSMQYRKSHLPGSLWAIRPRLLEMIQSTQKPIVIISDDPALTYGALLELHGCNLMAKVYELQGPQFPKEFEVISSDALPPDADCIDFLFFVHDRHDGNKDAARRYLEWETGLIAQLDEDEINLYSIQ